LRSMRLVALLSLDPVIYLSRTHLTSTTIFVFAPILGSPPRPLSKQNQSLIVPGCGCEHSISKLANLSGWDALLATLAGVFSLQTWPPTQRINAAGSDSRYSRNCCRQFFPLPQIIHTLSCSPMRQDDRFINRRAL